MLGLEDGHSLLVHGADFSPGEEVKVLPEQLVKLHESDFFLGRSAEDLVEKVLHLEELLSPDLPVYQQQQLQ